MSWEQYKKIKLLGAGAFGSVFLCQNTSTDAEDDYVAIKCVPLGSVGAADAKAAMGEVAILQQLNHPHVIRLLQCFIDQESNLCIVMEFADGGDLDCLIRSAKKKKEHLDAFVIADIARQMLDGISYLHSQGILHRDLKPANIYITADGIVKIGDFGVSKLLTVSMPHAKTFIGTPFYVCPELCMGEVYSYEADIWALGVMLYELLCLKQPFQAGNVLALVNVITDGKYDRQVLANRVKACEAMDFKSHCMASLVEKLVLDMLVLDPSERPTAAALLSKYFSQESMSNCSLPVTSPLVQYGSPPDLHNEREPSRRQSLVSNDVETSQPSLAAVELGEKDSQAQSKSESELANTTKDVPIEEEQLDAEEWEGGKITVYSNSATNLSFGVSAMNIELNEDNGSNIHLVVDDVSGVMECVEKPGASQQHHPTSPQFVSHYDPVELERMIREKAALFHKKRHDKLRRDREQMGKKDPTGTKKFVGGVEPKQQISLSPMSIASLEARGASVHESNKSISPLRSLIKTNAAMMSSIHQVAVALFDHENEGRGGGGDGGNGSAPRPTLATVPRNDNDNNNDDEEEDDPKIKIEIILPTLNGLVKSFHLRQSSSFKKFQRRCRKQLDKIEEEHNVVINRFDLVYLDKGDGADRVAVENSSEWKFCVSQHMKHCGPSQMMSLQCLI